MYFMYQWSVRMLCRVGIINCICLSISSINAQIEIAPEIFTITGTVKSNTDSLGIPYAHVYLLGKVTGTVTNSEGQFELKVPKELSSVEICFSSLGFSSKSLIIDNRMDWKHDIYLDETTYQLDEVVVKANVFDSASYILNTAIRFIKFNYPSKSHLLEGFFRELSLKDTTYTRLIEAAVRVQEVGYGKKYYKDDSGISSRVKVIELRKSDDFREYDLLSRVSVLMFGERNELYMILSKNYVRMLDQKMEHQIFSHEHLSQLDKTYEGIDSWNGERAYVISLTTHSDSKFFRHEKIRLFINKSDFAIVRIEHLGIPNPMRNEIKKQWLIEGEYFNKMEATYRKINGKYIPVFIHSIHSAYDVRLISELSEKTQLQYNDVLFLLTNIYEDEYSKIRWRQAEVQDKDLYKNDAPYHEAFWKTYNTVKLNPLKRNTKDLEKEMPLNEQYKKKGKNND